jgi:hypothetical protein
MFGKIAAVIDDNGRSLAAPRQDQGQSQDGAVTVEPVGWLFHDSPPVLSGFIRCLV